MFVPMTSDRDVIYIAAFYTVIYCIVYTLIYNLGFANALAHQEKLISEDEDAARSSVVQPVLENENTLKEELDYQENEDELSSPENLQDDYTPIPYNHALWPSPRPVNFVHAIIKADPDFKIYSHRLTHSKAVDILAQRAYMTRREFLNTNPLSYSQRYMNGLNALYLLKDSIDTLEDMLRNEPYKQALRRLENGRCVCPRY
jgi:hypothetical protein